MFGGVYLNHRSLVVEPTNLNNISQIGSYPQVGVKIKNVGNHEPVILFRGWYSATDARRAL